MSSAGHFGRRGDRPLHLRRGALETWEPEFTFHGFHTLRSRSARRARPSTISAVVVHSDMERTGWFSCSDDLVNRLHENVVGAARQLLSVPPTARSATNDWAGPGHPGVRPNRDLPVRLPRLLGVLVG